MLKSPIYSLKQFESWCEIAYKMGYWQALNLVGLHTNGGSRYIAAARKHAKSGKSDGED